MNDILYIATKNSHKIREIEAMLDLPHITAISCAELGDIDVTEDGGTFKENAEKKVSAWLSLTGSYVLADDSGLEVPALGNAPGVYSARYARPHDDAANNAKLLEKMRGFSDEERQARFVCSVAVGFRGSIVFTARGTVEGRILHAPRGENGFGYDPLFLYPPKNRTFAELASEEKNMVSHRFDAIRKVKAFLMERSVSHG